MVLVGCGGDEVTPPPPVGCQSAAVVTLAPGAHQAYTPAASGGCLRFPATAADAEYLVGVVSGSGQVTQSGLQGPYVLQAGSQGSLGAAQAPPSAPERASLDLLPDTLSWPLTFHMALRRREQELLADPTIRAIVPLAAPAAVPPTVGSERSFSVCANLACTQFDTVAAVARYVGPKGAVYMDKTLPAADSLSQADLNQLGQTFDQHHYPIGVNAFGTESDIDGNSVVVILLTDAVNALTPNCSQGRVLGFFWGGDLLTVAGSNRGEIFYGLVPAPTTPQCTALTRVQALARLKPTMIHELQHMISWNQHVTVRNGANEIAWLNEGLSHFAEELGGRLIPDSECPLPSGGNSCRSLYISGNLFNAYDYMEDTEGAFLAFPSSSSGTLVERGSGWLFVRWLADQFGSDDQGSNVTRGLVQTNQVGFSNVQTVTGAQFPLLVSEWFLALYADDLTGFTPTSPRISFESWGFRQTFELNCCAPDAPFEKAFPAEPPVITGSFTRSGTLRAGSGRHFRLLLSGGGSGLDLLLTRTSAGAAIDPTLEPRIAVVRVR